MWDANHNPADYGENFGRGQCFRSTFSRLALISWDGGIAIACEVLARRIVHLTEPDKIATVMSKRYQHRQIDGDASEMSSALEVAIDQHW